MSRGTRFPAHTLGGSGHFLSIKVSSVDIDIQILRQTAFNPDTRGLTGMLKNKNEMLKIRLTLSI